MSASKMRAAASDGKFDDFKTGIPSALNDADKKKLYFEVRKAMGIREEREMGDDFDSLRDAYLTGKIWNVGESVEANGVSGEVVRKGTNYLSFVTEDGKVHKAWLHELELDERNYKKEYANYQGTPEQIARRSSRNKARRAMGDKAVKGMDVGHKDNDPLNNSPDNLRNEDPSDNRREPRLREKPELDEVWYKDVMTKMNQISHPSDWGKIAKEYAAGMKDPEHRNHPSAWAQDVAQQYKGVTGRDLIKYINKLVDAGKLPKEIKAEVQRESFKSFVDQIQVQEVLGSSSSQKDYIDDFIDSDAPQFKGKSKKDRIGMAIAAFRSKNEEEDPCWDGYKQLGMKKKNGKDVPNCIPEETNLNEWGEIEEESEYQGRKVTLNKPTAGDVKKSKVYVKNEKGNVVKVNFGDPNMTIKVSDPARRSSFRARHNCENPGPKWKARYWSCKAW
jgi:hypothetical protein